MQQIYAEPVKEELITARLQEIYRALPQISGEGMAVVLVEQDVQTAQRMSQRLYCFQEGRVSLQGESARVSREQISRAYFGV